MKKSSLKITPQLIHRTEKFRTRNSKSSNILSYIECFLLCIAVVLSMVSQLPMMEDTSLGVLFRMSWILPLFPLVLFRPFIFLYKYIIVYFSFVILFLYYCFSCEFLTDEKYIGVDFVNISISFMIFSLSFVLYRTSSKRKMLETIFSTVLLISGVIIGYIVNSTAELTSALDSTMYAYQNKNSMGQILLCCAVIPLYLSKQSSKYINIIKFVLVTYLIIIIFLLKSRATLLGFFFIAAYYVFSLKNKKLKFFIIGGILLSILLIVFIPELNDMIIKQILFANRDATDLDDASSGRTGVYPQIVAGIVDSPLIGNGNMYFDCMPLIMVYQYGILGASFVFVFIFYVFIKLYKKRNLNSKYTLAYILYISYLLDSLFEAQPPFGPGIKCSLLWVSIGFALASKNHCVKNSMIKVNKITL